MKSAKCFGLYDENKIIGFMGVLHQPHYINKKLKRVTRLVILPDYQGVGLGVKFLNEIAKYYNKLGFDFSIVTSAKNLISALSRNDKWLLFRYGKQRNVAKRTSKIDRFRELRKCITASFVYKKS